MAFFIIVIIIIMKFDYCSREPCDVVAFAEAYGLPSVSPLLAPIKEHITVIVYAVHSIKSVRVKLLPLVNLTWLVSRLEYTT